MCIFCEYVLVKVLPAVAACCIYQVVPLNGKLSYSSSSNGFISLFCKIYIFLLWILRLLLSTGVCALIKGFVFVTKLVLMWRQWIWSNKSIMVVLKVTVFFILIFMGNSALAKCTFYNHIGTVESHFKFFFFLIYVCFTTSLTVWFKSCLLRTP